MTAATRERKPPIYGRAPGKPTCSFGKGCYRKNPKHFAEEDHPAEHPLIAAEAAAAPPPPPPPPPAPAPAAPAVAAPTTAPPPAKRPRDEDDEAFEASLADFDIDAAVANAVAAGATPPSSKTSHAAAASSSSADGAAKSVAAASSSSSASTSAALAAPSAAPASAFVCGSDRGAWHAQLREAFLVGVGDDAFDVFEHAAQSHPAAPLSAWASAGLTLVGPFRLLAGELAFSAASPLTDRGPHDPPELMPLARFREPSGALVTVGYWRDDPAAPTPLLVISRPNAEKQGAGVEIRVHDETHLMAMLHQLCQVASGPASVRAPAYARAAENLRGGAAALGVASVLADGAKAGAAHIARRKAAIAPTSSKMGIRVPYERATELGYRKLEPSGAGLRKLLDEMHKANGGTRAAYQKELDDLIGWATIANDECDFGASLQLGQDLFNHALAFAPVAARTLYTSYMLLEREPYAQIAKLHSDKRT